MNVFRHDCYTLGVDGTKVSILKETNEVCLGGLLEGKNCRSLETKIGLEILCDLTNKALEGQLANEKVC